MVMGTQEANEYEVKVWDGKWITVTIKASRFTISDHVLQLWDRDGESVAAYAKDSWQGVKKV